MTGCWDEKLEPLALQHERCSAMRAWPVSDRVGESPVWRAAEHALYWIDVRAPSVQRLEPASGWVRRWPMPDVVGALAPRGDGSFWVALRDRVALFDPAANRLEHVAFVPERAGNRLNDGKASPSGRWFVFGSMDDAPENKQATGALYRMGADGALSLLHAGLVVANGIAFSPCGTRLYFSDSARGRVFSCAWDEARGEAGACSEFARLDEAAGRPDGAAVDAQGRYWSAGVSAGVLNCLSPGGAVLDTLHLPCRAPTMPADAGEAGWFVTSLVRPGWPQAGTLDGALLQFTLRGDLLLSKT